MGERGATAPQLRRFIKSRAYVPMHELRRRFAINGGDDEVTGVDVDRQRVYVGLPEREGRRSVSSSGAATSATSCRWTRSARSSWACIRCVR